MMITVTSSRGSAAFDCVLTALFHGLTWSVQQNASCVVRAEGRLLCSIVEGRLYRAKREIDVVEVISRDASRSLGARARRSDRA